MGRFWKSRDEGKHGGRAQHQSPAGVLLEFCWALTTLEAFNHSSLIFSVSSQRRTESSRLAGTEAPGSAGTFSPAFLGLCPAQTSEDT